MFVPNIAFTLICFHIFQNNRIINASPVVEEFCENNCPLIPEYPRVPLPDPEAQKNCKNHCLVIVELQDFGRKISLSQWTKKTDLNTVLSPLSMGALLNLLMIGTRGSTSQEIIKALSYSSQLEENIIHEKVQYTLSLVQRNTNNLERYFYTRIFLQKDFTVLESFKSTLGKYISDVEFLDFNLSPDIAKERINSWVSDATERKIGEVISGSLSPNTVSIAVNFLYFKSPWAFDFKFSLTQDGTFHTGSENIVIPMMTTLVNAKHFSDEANGFDIVSIPYMFNTCAMYILQPKGSADVSRLQEIENTLDPTELNNLIDKMEVKLMEVTIPKMKIELKLSLKEDLMSLGINQIFGAGGDFGNLISEQGMLINDLIHVGILEINEAGTNTDVPSNEHITRSEESIVFNSPFVIFIRDTGNDIIIFWSRVVRPELIN